MNKKIVVLAAGILFALRLQAASETGFVHLQQNRLVDASGKELQLKAVNLGGWLLWEGWIWGGGFTQESDMKSRLQLLLGEKYPSFINTYYKNYITEKDIALIAASGFNSIRLPFNHRLFQHNSSINGYAITDSLLTWCRHYHIYLVLDLHAAPGGQSPYFIADPEKPHLFESAARQDSTVALWQAIAKKYNNEPMIAGYDLLNEPDCKTDQLVDLYRRIVAGIRTVDSNHLLIVEGNKLAKNFKGFPALFDDNQLYSFHYYSWFSERKKEKNIQDILMQVPGNAPVWCGEWGEDTIDNIEELKKYFSGANRICGTAFWTWKKLYKNNNRKPPAGIDEAAGWDKINNWLTWKFFKPSKDETEKAVASFLAGIRLDDCVIYNNVLNLLTD